MNYMKNMFLITAAPVTQLVLIIGGVIGGQSATMGDWLLGSIVPLYGWYWLLFS